jgi:EAL domain-containing protein (putative c-di-GMP-specific phosphodiesterase class I)
VKSASDRFVLALQIRNEHELETLFGKERVGDVRRDIHRGFRRIADRLLERQDVLRDRVATSLDFRFLPFSFQPSVLFQDRMEQIMALKEAGTRLTRSMLHSLFGQAPGDTIDFKLVVEPFSDDVDQTEMLGRYVLDLMETCEVTGLSHARLDRGGFQRILSEESVETFLQPIVALGDERPVGFEALSRGPEGSPVRSAPDLFNTAAALDLTEALELLCVRKALETVRRVPDEYWVSINVGPGVLAGDPFLECVLSEATRPVHPRVIFELTEHVPLDAAPAFADRIETLRDRGIRWSLDDTGCGFVDLETVRAIRPHIVKMCITLVQQVGEAPEVAAELGGALEEMKAFCDEVLGEGVERTREVDALKSLGVSLAQGYLHGKPLPAAEALKAAL